VLRKKFDDIFSHLDTIHEHDGQTPGDSKDRAYAWRRAVKTKYRIIIALSGC